MGLVHRIAAAAAALVMLLPGSAHAANRPGPWESRMIADINHVRAEHHLPTLQADSLLETGARQWSRHMHDVGYIYHDPPRLLAIYPGANFIAENVGQCYGCSADEVFSLYMHSPHHRDNILDPRVHFVGVGRYGHEFDTIDETDRRPEQKQ